MKSRACIAVVIACSVVLAAATQAGVSPAKIDFSRDIQPIFAERCYSCHGPEKHKGGLRLDRRADALTGGDSGKAILPGNSGQSLLISNVAGLNPDSLMPPKGERLSAEQIATLRAWIDQGANWPEDIALSNDKPKFEHWAFKVPRRPALPEVRNRRWLRNPIDAFVLSRLEKQGIAPAPEADKVTLIRRLSFDLLGLPPDRDEVQRFLADKRPEAYEELVDRFLRSPNFGERWARHWLDLARYADSDGYEKDGVRPYAYLYRNWVIDAINRDLAFDQFSIEQIAGDLLPDATIPQKTATGFHRQTLTNKEGGVDQEEFRCKATVDRATTTGAIWLGLTVGCAECHSHKYDPVTQKEFYQFYAFFNNTTERELPVIQEEAATRKLDPEIAPHGKKEPKSPEIKASILVENAEPRPTHIHVRGDFLRKGEEVQPGTFSILHGLKPRGTRPDRLDLAEWLFNSANPLTSRVSVNHIWLHLFGRGLVNTVNDFGTRGEPPSHPELLDWLATEFPRLGWSRKALIRLIVTSATYRQSSAIRPELLDRDPNNILLARQNRFRLEAEVVRDSFLACSGLLAPKIGGASIRPPLPPDIAAVAYANSVKWNESKGADRYRRGLYIFLQRTIPYPMLVTFDAPDSNVTCTRRERSNTPLQALTLLNDNVFFECAQSLGNRIAAEPLTGTTQKASRVFEICLGRSPTAEETDRLVQFWNEQHRLLDPNLDNATKMLGRDKPVSAKAADAATLVALARTVMNLDEFLTRE